jgi:hypothetical protein
MRAGKLRVNFSVTSFAGAEPPATSATEKVAMSEFWIRAIEQAEAAEEEARQLRARYGRDAEAKIDEALRSEDRRRREDLQDVRRALRWT